MLGRWTHSAAAGSPADPARGNLDDLGDLLGAVKWRLRRIAGERLDSDSGLPSNEAREQIQLDVLDCAAALDQLHAVLQHALGRHRLLERQVLDARSALVRARPGVASQPGPTLLHDTLTRLPDCHCLQHRLERALAAPGPPGTTQALLYLGIVGFRPAGPVVGHDVGDDVLEVVAARLSRAVRVDDLVARLDGDRFACLLASASGRDQLSHVASKLLDAVSMPLRIGPLRFSVAGHIGIATCSADAAGAMGAMDANGWLERAANAMARARLRQTGYAFFD